MEVVHRYSGLLKDAVVVQYHRWRLDQRIDQRSEIDPNQINFQFIRWKYKLSRNLDLPIPFLRYKGFAVLIGD